MPSTDLSRRLTTTDASFLYFERPGEPLHIGSINVYEGRVSREDVIRTLEERLHLLPRYRQKVVFPPFGIAHPTWEDDPAFDVRNHVAEVELPAPGDDRTLSTVAGQVFTPLLDRNRPLWKLVLLQGHESGNTHMVSIVHHAMVDGVSGVELQMVLHDLTPKAEPPAAPVAPWQPQPPRDEIAILQDAVRDRLEELARLWTDETFRPLRPQDAERRMRQVTNALTSAMPYMTQPAPRVPFNGPLSGERHFAWVELPFAEVRGIRSALGGTVNDVVLAILSGALGRYLRAHNVPVTPAMELRAMCPVSVRAADGRGSLGNQVSMMMAPLYVGIDDPMARLRAEREAMERLKGLDQAGGLHALSAQADAIPAGWQAFVGQFPATNTLLNTVSTNVPGPQIPMYFNGKQLLGWYPLGPLSSGIGLFNAILSYNQKLTFGATADPRLVPDVWFFADCLRESFAELRDAAGRAAAVQDAAKRAAEAPPAPAPNGATNGRTNGRKPRGRKAKEPASAARR
jgi:diacylglycerol O-acyltransferase / wax synthase